MPDSQTKYPTVAVVGARGLVGREALSILLERGWASSSLRVFGSPRSVGETIDYGDHKPVIEAMDTIVRDAPDYVLLCADTDTARSVVDLLSDQSTTIIDNSSAFRLHSGTPLVIPEVNGELLQHDLRVIANPNCSTIMLLTALSPLRAAFGVRSVQVSTYQAVSGAGRAGLESLHTQTRAKLNGEPIPDGVFPVPCAFDVFEHESEIDPTSGFNGEESKMIEESRKIWESPALSLLPTCVRVPVERAHAQSITVEFNRTVTADQVRDVLGQSPGLALVEPGEPLTPASIAGQDEVFVGRIRIDPSDSRRVLLWVCCDQIRKGAALNAVQIMERLIGIRDQSSASSARLTSTIEASGYACSS